jgi:hypothetical protein
MKLCASYQVQWWQTDLCSEIANFLNPQNVMGDLSQPIVLAQLPEYGNLVKKSLWARTLLSR